MLILPYKADLSLAKTPYITYFVIVLCLLIHYAQHTNRVEINEVALSYCAEYDTSGLESGADARFSADMLCQSLLPMIHSSSDPETTFQRLESDLDFVAEDFMPALRGLYDGYVGEAPRSLDQQLMYDPKSWNPITMISAAFAHGDWMHVLGNLVFFFAFAAALEIIVGPLRYVVVIFVIAFATHITYSLFTLGDANAMPTLGLSGVVTGMIGLAAFMMPSARIKSLFWFFTIVRRIYIPAWVLALWYIGLDTWELFSSETMGGVNLVAHVSGGVAGYVLGRLWLKNRRDEVKEELDDEINERQVSRSDRVDAMRISKEYQQRMAEHARMKQANRVHGAYMDRLHKVVTTANDSEAINMILAEYEQQQASIEIYEQLFDEIGKWRQGITWLCLGRLVISMLLTQKQTARALAIADACFNRTEEFVLADPKDVSTLMRAAMQQKNYELAHKIIHRAGGKYRGYINQVNCLVAESKLLIHHLDRAEQARPIVKKLISVERLRQRTEIQMLAELVGVTSEVG